MNNQPSDITQRQAAVDPTRSFIVQAPAGSGKTELLTDRILALLSGVSKPEEIVAITFTRKAAAEMHARVMDKLFSATKPKPEEPYKQRSWELAQLALENDNKQGWQLLQHPSRLKIRTIDAFCSHLTKSMPWLSGMGGLSNIADKAGMHYDYAARMVLEMVDEVPAVGQFLEHLDLDYSAAIAMLSDMLKTRDQWLSIVMQDNLDALQDNLKVLVEHSLHFIVQNLESTMPYGWKQDLSWALLESLKSLGNKSHYIWQDVLAKEGPDAFKPEFGRVELWHLLSNMLLTNDNKPRSRITVEHGFPPKSKHKELLHNWLRRHSDGKWANVVASIKNLPIGGYSSSQMQYLSTFKVVLKLAHAALQLRFAEVAEVDFVEVSQRALQALGSEDMPTDLLLSLDARISHILVDEFQDTSNVQIQVLERLVAGWEPNDGRTLFLVGDPMQSIYRFRKAEVGLFLLVQKHGLGNIPLESLYLSENFRSQAGLVEVFNRYFSKIFPPKDNADTGGIRYSPSIAFNPDTISPAMSFHAIRKESDEELHRAQNRVDKKVVELVKQTLSRHKNSEKPVAVLVRSRSHLNQVMQLMSSAGISYKAIDLEGLGSRPVVQDLLQLIRAISHNSDRLAWLSVLRSPLCGLTLNSMHALFGNDFKKAIPDILASWLKSPDSYTGISRSDVMRIRKVSEILIQAAQYDGHMSFASWVQDCWDALGGNIVYSNETDRSDAESVFRLLEQMAPYGHLNMDDFQSAVNQLYASTVSSDRTVEIMTMHKSKGLEFEAVILMGLCRINRNSDKKLLQTEQSGGYYVMSPVKRSVDQDDDPISRFLSEREKERDNNEKDRLLYVAMTRARSELHIVSTVSIDKNGQVKKPNSTSMLGSMWDMVQPIEMPDDNESTESEYAGSIKTHPHQLLIRLPDHIYKKMNTPSIMTGHQPDNSQMQQSWSWQKLDTAEAITGTVAHEWLERIARDGLANWNADKVSAMDSIFRKQLKRAGVTDISIDQSVMALKETLEATLKCEKGRWLLQVAKAYREWSLIDSEGRVSIIDLAISDEKGWLVVDYKTSVPHENEDKEQFMWRMKQLYSDQMQRYKQQVSALDGRNATAALYLPRAGMWIDL